MIAALAGVLVAPVVVVVGIALATFILTIVVVPFIMLALKIMEWIEK